ncbi:MAG: N-ethylmaleimide reductase [Pseudomonadales bacterium]|jgi:N-ethylmaleimide reductase
MPNSIDDLNDLLSPTMLGKIAIANRVVMAPMTRSRADSNDCPTQLHIDYYSQRASAGLIITEGTQPSKTGKGYCRTPGIYNTDQISAWAKVTESVHAKGGKIALQIMHCGRVGGAANKAIDADTVAPSAIACEDEIFTEHGMQPMVTPRALDLAEIPSVIAEYKQATINAFAASFDGVELHCTSGYLPAQFLSTGTNKRDDNYGGSLENRLRFVLEVLQAMNSVDGAGRVGVRICPGNPFNGLQDDNPGETFAALLKTISNYGQAYVHVIRMPKGPVDNLALVKNNYEGAVIVNDSYTAREADDTIQSNEANAVSFGRDFIANPDLVYRLKNNIALTRFDMKTLYTLGANGFSDYPNAS